MGSARLPPRVNTATVETVRAMSFRRRRRLAACRGLLALALGAASAVGACVVDGAAVLGERQFNAARSSTPMLERLGSY